MEQCIVRGLVLAALLFASTECGLVSQGQHAQRERGEVMLDPTADIGKRIVYLAAHCNEAGKASYNDSFNE